VEERPLFSASVAYLPCARFHWKGFAKEVAEQPSHTREKMPSVLSLESSLVCVGLVLARNIFTSQEGDRLEHEGWDTHTS